MIDLKSYNPLKNARKRLPIWLLGIITLLLVDEYVKEGYVFDPSDIAKPLTHENLIVALSTALIITLLRSLKNRKS